MVLMIDNYDSFTYNLVQLIGGLGGSVEVFRNDAISVERALAMRPSHLVISPGPGRPAAAGVSMAMIEAFAETTPVLGVCLGHQAIAEVFGGRVVAAPSLMHGKVSPVFHRGSGVFRELGNPFVATRYHSLAVDEASLPDRLEINAWTEEGVIMGLRVQGTRVAGVQFHPESILTTEGTRLLDNFLRGDDA
jgi:anthranilate synthase component 2